MEKKQQCIIVIGAPGSGKSTHANKLLVKNPTLKLLSSDSLRAELGNGEEDQSVTPLVFITLKNRLRQYLALGESVIVDATNINKRDRKDYIDAAKLVNATVIGFVFECNKATLMKRNQHRAENGGRNVPEFVIDKMLDKYQKPEKSEGFDELYFL